ncbi:MAG: nuclear transport factor 2 family protein [Nanoarchaeota archaeon]
MRPKKILLLLSLLMLLVLILTGCFGIDETKIEQNVDSKIKQFITALEDEDVDSIDKALASDFEWHLNGESIFDSEQGYVDMMKENFNNEQEIDSIDYKNKVFDIESDSEVTVSGDWQEEGSGMDDEPDGEPYELDQKVTFILEKIDGKWLITKMESVDKEEN